MKYKVGDRLISSDSYIRNSGLLLPFRGVIVDIKENNLRIRLTQSPSGNHMIEGRIITESHYGMKDWRLEVESNTLTSLYDKLHRERFTL